MLEQAKERVRKLTIEHDEAQRNTAEASAAYDQALEAFTTLKKSSTVQEAPPRAKRHRPCAKFDLSDDEEGFDDEDMQHSTNAEQGERVVQPFVPAPDPVDMEAALARIQEQNALLQTMHADLGRVRSDKNKSRVEPYPSHTPGEASGAFWPRMSPRLR